jgi:hypothetical protein
VKAFKSITFAPVLHPAVFVEYPGEDTIGLYQLKCTDWYIQTGEEVVDIN